MRNDQKDFMVANLGYRIGAYHPKASVQIGVGNSNSSVVVVQPHTKMPERDSITGALKRFGMLGDSYRATSMIVDEAELTNLAEINRYYLKELIELINPLIVVTCGPEATALMRDKKIRSFKSHAGKKFSVHDLTTTVFYATLNPTDYGFARASAELKEQGKAEWQRLAKLHAQLKAKAEKARWA
jgi:hypothetical protein